MMTATNEQKVRERAYFIWEREGRPQGKELEHWQAALRELGIEINGTNRAVAKPVASSSERKPAPSRRSRIKAIVAEAKDALEGAAQEIIKPKRKRAAKEKIENPQITQIDAD